MNLILLGCSSTGGAVAFGANGLEIRFLPPQPSLFFPAKVVSFFMDRYNHILKRSPPTPPKPEMTALEKFQAVEVWYQSGHFESIIEELKEYLKPVKEIEFEKDAGWLLRAHFFDRSIIFRFQATFDKGFFIINFDSGPIRFQTRTRSDPIIFEIDSQGKIIGHSLH
jgi:hypothetical protein